MSFREKLIIGMVNDLIPDIKAVDPIKPEAVKIKAILQEMTGFFDLGEMKTVVGKLSDAVVFSVENNPDDKLKARRLLATIERIINDQYINDQYKN